MENKIETSIPYKYDTHHYDHMTITMKNPLGYFKHRETEVAFHFFTVPVEDIWAKEQGATHYINPFSRCDFEHARAAKVLKTVVYVAVDENAYGNAVWEKWHIKQREDYYLR